jgi:hypothetical protein
VTVRISDARGTQKPYHRWQGLSCKSAPGFHTLHIAPSTRAHAPLEDPHIVLVAATTTERPRNTLPGGDTSTQTHRKGPRREVSDGPDRRDRARLVSPVDLCAAVRSAVQPFPHQGRRAAAVPHRDAADVPGSSRGRRTADRHGRAALDLGVSPGAVRAIRHRAMARLRDCVLGGGRP